MSSASKSPDYEKVALSPDVEASVMEKGTATTRAKRIQRPMPMEVNAVPDDSEELGAQDFWTCCLAQGFFGLIGALVVLLCNSHRRGYPTQAAWAGFGTAFGVILILYLIYVVSMTSNQY